MAYCAWRWILPQLFDHDLKTLLDTAGRSVWHGYRHGARLPFDIRHCSWGVRAPGITYVSLTIDDQNVGCQGNTEPTALILSAATNAFSAAFRDRRFGSLTSWGMQNAQLTVYHLYDSETYQGLAQQAIADKIQKQHSLQVSIENLRGILLSTMQDRSRSAASFVSAVLDKADIHVRCPFEHCTFTLYQTQVLGPVPLAHYET